MKSVFMELKLYEFSKTFTNFRKVFMKKNSFKIDKFAIKKFFKTLFICLVALAIPSLLILNGIQARKYKELRDSVKELEEKQVKLVEENKKLITDITLLSSSDRIEKIATEELNMKEAQSDEIVRVEMQNKK